MKRVVSIALVAVSGAHAQALPAATWRLAPDLQIARREDGPSSFADVRGLVATADGSIVILEYQAQELRLFDATGRFVRLLARRGSGPGEIQMATDIAISPDEIIWANDPGNRRYTRYSLKDKPIEYTPFQTRTFAQSWGAAIDSRGRLFEPNVFTGNAIDPATGRSAAVYKLRFIEPSGESRLLDTPSCRAPNAPPIPPRVRYQNARGSITMLDIPFVARPQLALTRSGNVWCTPSSDYRLFYGPPENLKEVFYRRDTPMPVTATERTQALARFDSMSRMWGQHIAGDPQEIPGTKPIVESVFVDDAERLWVKLTGTPDESPEFDVVTPSGTLVARVKAQGKVGRIVFVLGDKFYTVVRDDDDVPAIVRYSILKK